MRNALLIFIATISVPANAETGSTAVPTGLTSQQIFDNGSAAIAARDWNAGLNILMPLEAGLASRAKQPVVLAAVRARIGYALTELGRYDEAESMLRAAIAVLPVDNPNFSDDRFRTQSSLGDLAEHRFDYPDAVRWYMAAHNGSTKVSEQLAMLVPAIRIGIFVDRDQALSDADRAVNLADTTPEVDIQIRGWAHQLRARVLLNLNRLVEARAESARAIKLLGGLGTRKINGLDVAARSDAAIIELRDNKPEAAHRLLYLSGAAKQSNQGFKLAADLGPPPCGGINGPNPEDVAVVSFAIGSDGVVTGARPVYFSGKPEAAIEFARAVARWSWSPAELKQVDPFFRNQTQIELRCTNAFKRPPAALLLGDSLDAWLTQKSVASLPPMPEGEARQLPLLRAGLDREMARSGETLKLIPWLVAIAQNDVSESRKSHDAIARAIKIADVAQAPPAARAYLNFVSWSIDVNYGPAFVKRLRAGFADPLFSADRVTRAALAISLFDALSWSERAAEAKTLLMPIASDPNFADNDPFKVGALIRLANAESIAGEAEAARQHFAQTGLSSQQCALVDANPSQIYGSFKDSDYPTEALLLGFSGWAITEFDIAADGHTVNPRAVVSFPPFVFGPASVGQIKKWQYTQTYRPEGGLGCGAMRQNISFISAWLQNDSQK